MRPSAATARRVVTLACALALCAGGGSAFAQTLSGVNAIRVLALYGVMSARVQEDIDQPQVLGTAAEQQNVSFVLDFFTRLKRDPATSAEISRLRPMLKGGRTFDQSAAGKEFTALEAEIADGLAPSLKQAFLGGLFAQQSIFNARVQRQRQFDSVFRSYLQSADALDQIAPDAARMRADLDKLPPDAPWDTIAAKAGDLVHLILSAAVSSMRVLASPSP